MPSDPYGIDDQNPLGKKPPASAASFVPERLLDSDEAAKIMNVHPKTLQKLARKGIVRGVHVGSCGVSEPPRLRIGFSANLPANP